MIPNTLIATTALITLATATTSSKRGLCHVPNDKTPSDDTIWTSTPNSDLTWYYNYKDQPSSDLSAASSSLHFVPMLWGASASTQGTPFLDSIKVQLAAGANITHVLGFNEPDGTQATGGSNVPASLAATTWIAQIEPLKKLGIKVGAPAVTGSPGGFTWLDEWKAACMGGCNPDFVPVHWYGDFEGLASHVGQVVNMFPDLSIWVTEWAYPNQNLKVTQEFFNQSLGLLDRWGNVSHYSYFGAFRSSVSNVGPNAAMLTEKGKLTDIGSWYLGGAATNNIPHKGGAGAKPGPAATLCWSWSVVVIVMTWLCVR